MWALTAVIDGMDANIPLLFEQALDDLPYIAENNDPYIQKHAVSSSSVSDLFAGTGLLPYGRYVDVSGKEHFARGDWRKEYWDDTSNQAYHFWFYVGVSFFDNKLISNFGNTFHDPKGSDRVGVSDEDWNLGVAGGELGEIMRKEYIMLQLDCIPTPYSIRISRWIRANLKGPVNKQKGR